jgi:hypothetical protein
MGKIGIYRILVFCFWGKEERDKSQKDEEDRVRGVF